MNFLSIVHKHKSGGFHKRMYRLFRYVLENDHKLHVLCAERLPLSHPGLVQHIVRAPFSRRENLLFWLYFMAASWLQAIRIWRKYDIGRVVTFGPFYTVLCMAPIVIGSVTSVTFVRGDNMRHERRSLLKSFFFIADWLGLAVSSKVVFNSAAMREVYCRRYGIPRSKLLVIPNNTEATSAMGLSERERLRRSYAIENDCFLIATSGVLSQGKNISFLLRAMKGLAPHKIRLIIIGDETTPNGERQKLERMADDLGIRESVIFAGWQDDPRPLLCISDLYVFPSRSEGSPNALLEALGCGLPCLGSDIPEIREILFYDDLLFPLHEIGPIVEKIRESSWNRDLYEHLRRLSELRRSKFLFDWNQEILSAIQTIP